MWSPSGNSQSGEMKTLRLRSRTMTVGQQKKLQGVQDQGTRRRIDRPLRLKVLVVRRKESILEVKSIGECGACGWRFCGLETDIRADADTDVVADPDAIRRDIQGEKGRMSNARIRDAQTREKKKKEAKQVWKFCSCKRNMGKREDHTGGKHEMQAKTHRGERWAGMLERRDVEVIDYTNLACPSGRAACWLDRSKSKVGKGVGRGTYP